MEYYDEIAPGYNALYGEEQKKKARKVQELLQITPEETVLDIGCGSGIATTELGGKKTGIDPSLALIKQAKFPVVHGKAEQLPFKDKSFDNVVCMTAIHHFDTNKALLEIKRVAKNKIAISVLKNAKNFGTIASAISAVFQSVQQFDTEKDTIFIAKP
ncbi:methyltransferase domain-containing protein [Candidatus Woesearchaeota archaeon]|nr:methyltransferase domain-containing protein [Candidatus Woesearchaeota archaeon]